MTTPVFSVGASLFAASLLLSGTTAMAQSRAVEKTNFEFGIASSDSDTSDSTSNGTLGVNAAATIPLGGLFGVSLSGYYSESSVRTRDALETGDGANTGGQPSCNFDSLGGDVSLFARMPSLGKIGVTYGVGKLTPDCGDNSVFLPSGEDELRTDSYRIDAEFYLGDFTLGAARTSTDLDEGSKLESNSVVASWYPLDSLKVSLTGNDLYEQNTYGLMLEHQPEFMGDGFGLYVGYSRSDQAPETRTVYLGMSYYFGNRVDLKTRDRQYR